MPIHRLNHAVLYVRDVTRSVDFYREVLRFDVAFDMGTRAAFLRADGSTNDHDLGLIGVGARAGASKAGHDTVGLYHLAWEVETLRDLQELAHRLTEAGAMVGATDHSTTKSLYGRDPDGLEFEIAWRSSGCSPAEPAVTSALSAVYWAGVVTGLGCGRKTSRSAWTRAELSAFNDSGPI